MLWKFRYRDKFSAKDAMCEADGYDAMKAAAESYCEEHGFHFIPGSVVRAVLFTVVDGKRVMHDPTGKDVEKPVESKRVKKAPEQVPA